MSIEIFSGSENLIKLKMKILGGNPITDFIFNHCKETNKNIDLNLPKLSPDFFFWRGRSPHEYLIAQSSDRNCIMKGKMFT
jgi:hypothetical protein